MEDYFFDSVRKHFGFLLDEYEFRVTEETVYDSFDCHTMVLASNKCRVKFDLDRGSTDVSLCFWNPLLDRGSENDGRWYGIERIIAFLHSEMKIEEIQRYISSFRPKPKWAFTHNRSVERQLAEWAAKTRPYWSQILKAICYDSLDLNRDAIAKMEQELNELAMKDLQTTARGSYLSLSQTELLAEIRKAFWYLFDNYGFDVQSVKFKGVEEFDITLASRDYEVRVHNNFWHVSIFLCPTSVPNDVFLFGRGFEFGRVIEVLVGGTEEEISIINSLPDNLDLNFGTRLIVELDWYGGILHSVLHRITQLFTEGSPNSQQLKELVAESRENRQFILNYVRQNKKQD